MQDDPTINEGIKPQAERLSALNADHITTEQKLNTGYSTFINRVKFALPLIALIMIVTIFAWNNFEDDKIVAVKEEDVQPEIQQEIGKNELISPKFESIDDKGQPFTITADKAVQEEGEQGEMLLDNPVGTLKTNTGKTISIRAVDGMYHQTEQALNLQNNVVLNHSDGYTMTTNILFFDLATDKAWSQQPVHVRGPEGTIDAKGGIEATSSNETIIFKGPAKMLLKTDDNTLTFGNSQP